TVSTQAAKSRFNSARSVTWWRPTTSGSPVISTRNCSRTVLKNLSIFPRPSGRYGAECTRRTPRARPQQPFIDERRSAVNVDRLGDTAGGQRRPQRGGQPHPVLSITPPIAGQQPGMIV